MYVFQIGEKKLNKTNLILLSLNNTHHNLLVESTLIQPDLLM